MRTIKLNCGGSIKGVADVIFAIGAIASVIGAIVMLVFLINEDSFFAGLGAGILIAGGGCLISWLSTLALRGYGELIMYTAENATYLEEIERLLAQNAQGTTSASGAGNVVPAKNTAVEVAAQTTPAGSSTVYCGVCGAKNYYKNQVCVNCGHVLNR